MKAGSEPWRPWTTVAMLFAIQTLNRADKAVLGLAATALMADLSLSAEQYGFIASSFYFLYSIAGLTVGLLFVHRYRPRLILAVLVAIWSLAQLPVVLGASFTALLVSRIVLGMGEGNGTATCINACHEWFPPEKRDMPTALVMVGALIGPIVAVPVLSIVIDDFGWRVAFAACAAAGATMLIVWVLFSRDGPYSGMSDQKTRIAVSAKSASFGKMFLDRSILGSLILGLTSEWITAFMIAWLAPFAAMALGFGRKETGWLLSGVFVIHSCMFLGVAAASRWMIGKGVSTRVARPVLNGCCLVTSAACFLLVTQVSDAYLRMALMGLAVGLPAITFTLNPSMLSEILPTAQRNRVIHILMSLMTAAALIAPWLTGKLIGDKNAPEWTSVLLVNAAVALVGAAAAFLLIDPARSARRLRGDDAPLPLPSSAAEATH